MHREECQPRADEAQPEANLPDALVIHPTGDLWEPVVHAAEDREHGAAEDHKMEVRDDVVAGIHLLVERDRGDGDP